MDRPLLAAIAELTAAGHALLVPNASSSTPQHIDAVVAALADIDRFASVDPDYTSLMLPVALIDGLDHVALNPDVFSADYAEFAVAETQAARGKWGALKALRDALNKECQSTTPVSPASAPPIS